MLNSSYVDPDAAAKLAEEAKRPHGPLVQLGVTVPAKKSASTLVGAA
jgi:hypothetical protein